MDKAIEELDIENLGSPSSHFNLDMEQCQETSTPKPTALIKAELKIDSSGGQYVAFKDGNQYLNNITPQARDELKYAILLAHNSGGGVDSKKVLESLDTTIAFLEHGSPSVKQMRSGNPKAVQLLYHRDEMLKGSSKIKKTWAPENKPTDWPAGVPFEDPNNGTPKKTEKLKKAGLSQMYQVLRGEYIKKKDTIKKERENYKKSLPVTAQPIDESPKAQRLSTLYQRAFGLLQEGIGKDPLTTKMTSVLEDLLTLAPGAERLCIRFVGMCADIQKQVDIAFVREQGDREELISALTTIYEQYKVDLGNNSIQAVSDDTPLLHANATVPQRQGHSATVLPTPSNSWNHLAPQHNQFNNTQTTGLYLQENQEPMILQEPVTQPQPENQLLCQQPECTRDTMQIELNEKLSLQMTRLTGQPNTLMSNMENAGTYFTSTTTFSGEIDYSTAVLTQPTQPINHSVIPLKRKSSDIEESASGKLYASLEQRAPTTELTWSDYTHLKTAEVQAIIDSLESDNKVLGLVPRDESQEITQWLTQETNQGDYQTNLSYWPNGAETMEVD